jgi:hypothetical protein
MQPGIIGFTDTAFLACRAAIFSLRRSVEINITGFSDWGLGIGD